MTSLTGGHLRSSFHLQYCASQQGVLLQSGPVVRILNYTDNASDDEDVTEGPTAV